MNCTALKPVYTKKDYQFGIDWLQGYCFDSHVDWILRDLEIATNGKLLSSNWVKWNNSINFYSNRYCFADKAMIQMGYNDADEHQRELDLRSGSDYFLINQNCDQLELDFNYSRRFADLEGKYNRGIFFSFSGDGCRFLGSQDLYNVMCVLKQYNFVCTRLDVALDIFDPYNKIVPLIVKCGYNMHKKCKPRDYIPCVKSNIHNNWQYFERFDNKRFPGSVIRCDRLRFGAKGSNFGEFELYDKYFELYDSKRTRPFADDMINSCPARYSKYWYRLEYRVYNGPKPSDYKYAMTLFSELVNRRMTVEQGFAFVAGLMFTPLKSVARGANSFTVCGALLFPEWTLFLDYLNAGKDKISSIIHFVSSCFIVNSYKKYFSDRPMLYLHSLLVAHRDVGYYSRDQEDDILNRAIVKYFTDPKYFPELLQNKDNPVIQFYLEDYNFSNLIPEEIKCFLINDNFEQTSYLLHDDDDQLAFPCLA